MFTLLASFTKLRFVNGKRIFTGYDGSDRPVVDSSLPTAAE
jgi:hypothetical protein